MESATLSGDRMCRPISFETPSCAESVARRVLLSVEFELQAGGPCEARAGLLQTAHGPVATPVFMPVGTLGSVKGVSPAELRRLGASIILGNTYHLMLRPGAELVKQLGGLHRFSAWDGPILTDSGGFQVFSLARLGRVDDDGVSFRSHIDGSALRITPERAVEAQEMLGSDILMAFDQPPPPDAGRDAAEEATERTHRWAKRCLAAHRGAGSLFPICQGGMHEELRRESARVVAGLGAEGNAIGGLGLGERKELTWHMLEASVAMLPSPRPRYMMGIGAPEDLLEGVARGVDMFDCVLPTRLGRNGAVFTHDGKLNLRNAGLATRGGPIEDGCDCEACVGFSLGYLHHLFRCEELLGYRLASIHNLRFLVRLMEEARATVLDGRFESFHDDFRARYHPPSEEVRSEQRRRWREARVRWAESGSGPESGLV
jgi:queuine tRNA-ribosyltransferase